LEGLDAIIKLPPPPFYPAFYNDNGILVVSGDLISIRRKYLYDEKKKRIWNGI